MHEKQLTLSEFGLRSQINVTRMLLGLDFQTQKPFVHNGAFLQYLLFRELGRHKKQSSGISLRLANKVPFTTASAPFSILRMLQAKILIRSVYRLRPV